jgi:RNA 2',3'-cyclic 3'-phosphodiesterase
MTVVRTFIAIDLSDAMRERIADVEDQLKVKCSAIPIRWVPVENIHLTLVFLGDISVLNLALLEDALQIELNGYSSFEINVGQIGAFPSNQRPRVIWVGVEAPKELFEIQAKIENRLHHLGYPREDRHFSPHLTIGRMARGGSPRDLKTTSHVLHSLRIGFIGNELVQEICLFKSDLKPTGALYSRLATVKLSGKNIA